ncbi:MAG: DNA polymerase III subunit beta [Acidobacteria bacterium]|nr:DNA polymerase III subunit beta [Acidobacteriota bacterium]MBE3124523.1 DNA polymerase III subunit beta [Acidobacteriota bacterium]MBE3129237.1 DNA polymerase III subunit beta [Acidobacteriota bacterium]
MKFSLPKEVFLEELQLLQGIVEKRNTMPILANILMNVSASDIELTGTDLEVGLRTHLEAAIDKAGAITVNGKKIFEIVKSLPEGQTVQVEKVGDNIEIKAGDSEFKILCLPKEDYPQVPEPKFEKGIKLALKDVNDMIDRVYYAITQEQRYYLNGAQLSLKNRQIELVSTDGHRLAYTKKAQDGLKLDQDISVIVAKKTLNEIRKFEDETVEFDLDEHNLFFKVGRRTLISRIIDSKFPNYQAVIPKDNPGRLAVSREELANAIRRVSLLSAERSKGIKFTIEKNRMRLFSSNPEIGEARDRLAVEYKGQDLEIGFNAQYLLDFLTSVASERVVFEIKDENSAVLLKPEAEEGITNIYVLMPMKI